MATPLAEELENKSKQVNQPIVWIAIDLVFPETR
jgi:hypothetical protein